MGFGPSAPQVSQGPTEAEIKSKKKADQRKADFALRSALAFRENRVNAQSLIRSSGTSVNRSGLFIP